MKKEQTISLLQFAELIPDEKAAVKWYEEVRWGKSGRYCPHCGPVRTVECDKPQPYRCQDCRKHFSVKVGTVMQSSRLPVRKWLMAMYLMSVSKKGMSGLQLGRTSGIAPEAAWRLGHKIREAWNCGGVLLSSEVEVDETCIGGKERNKHAKKKLKAGRGFSDRHNRSGQHALDFMRDTAAAMEGRLLPHRVLVGGENGKCS